MGTFPSRLAVVVLVVVLAGCTSGGTGGVSSSSPTPTPTSTPTQTEYWVERAENTHEPKTITIENSLDRNVTVNVRIRMSGSTVDNESYHLAPGSSKEVYDTSTDDPDGTEAFAVVLTVGNVTMEEGVATNQCIGDPTYIISEDEDGEIGFNKRASIC